MNIRAFVSVDIPRNIKKEIRKIQENLPEFKGKLTEAENLHLTLKFLGYVPEEKIPEIKKQLGRVKLKKFETEINALGFFHPRIIWLHMANCEELQKETDEKLSGIFEKERRFMSHLTIARVKSVENKKRFIDKLKKIQIGKMEFVVDGFKLKKSTLTGAGPVYRALETYALE